MRPFQASLRGRSAISAAALPSPGHGGDDTRPHPPHPSDPVYPIAWEGIPGVVALALARVQRPAQGFPRQGTGVLTVVQQELAIDNDVIDANGALFDVHLAPREVV